MIIIQEVIQEIKNYVDECNRPDNPVFQKHGLLIKACFAKSIEILENKVNKQILITKSTNTPVENIIELLVAYRKELWKSVTTETTNHDDVENLDTIIYKIETDFKPEEVNELVLAWKDGCYNDKYGHPKSGSEYYSKRFEREVKSC